MALFLIVALQTSAAAIDAIISEKIPQQDSYKMESGKWIVDSPQLTSKAVSDALGLSATESHITVPVRAYFGRAQPDVWEWIAAKLAAKVNA